MRRLLIPRSPSCGEDALTADAINIPATPRPAGAGDHARPSQALPAVLIAGLLLSAGFVAFLYLMRGEAMFALPEQIASVHNEDFLAFWRAGVMSLNGEAASVYDTAAFLAPLPEAAAGLRFLNPPHFLLALAPLGLLPYGEAKLLFLILNLLALAALARLITDAAPRLQHRYAAVFFLLVFSPAMFASLLVLQIGPFVALLLAGGLLLARRRPIAAGLLLALLTMKPQFGLVAPLLLAAQGNWRAIIATMIWTSALCLGATMAFGDELWAVFLKSLSTVHAVHASLLHRDMVTVAQAVRKLGAVQNIAYAAQIAAAVFAAGLVWRSARRLRSSRDEARLCNAGTAETVGLTLLASALASPSLWVYDWPMVSAGVLMLAGSGKRLAPALQLVAILVWIAPLIPLGMLTQASSIVTTGFLAAGLAAFAIYRGALIPRAAS